MSSALRLSREDGADMHFAYVARLSGAISNAEFLGWVERVVADSDAPLPDYIYDLAFLVPEKIKGSELTKIIWNVSGQLTEGEDKVLMAISVLRDPDTVKRIDEPRPSTPKSALKVLKRYPDATQRFETFFPGLLP